mmetsp:Transcript_29715/g.86600  ORF Transcript_29715/g.86600 Transcript_29715/m.86600 type:complete len:303 (-) Transcript_29715:919-1827(-)
MTTAMLASMMQGAKIGDEPSSAVTNDHCADECPTIPCPGSFLPKTMSDGDLSAISIDNFNACGGSAGRRAAAARDRPASSLSTLGDDSDEEGEQCEQLVSVKFDKASIDDKAAGGGMRNSTSMVSFHSSCLKTSPSKLSLVGDNNGMRRVSSNVSFGSVSVREHERVVDDRPALPGPALGLGWAYNQKDDVHLDVYKKDEGNGTTTAENEDDEVPSKDGTENESKEASDKKYIEQNLSSFARSIKLRSYGFEHHELKTDAQKAREALAEGIRRADLAKRRKEQKKLSYKVKKALKFFATSES